MYPQHCWHYLPLSVPGNGELKKRKGKSSSNKVNFPADSLFKAFLELTYVLLLQCTNFNFWMKEILCG